MTDTPRAFRWIVGILERRGIPFQVVGGLAARVYGATRELHDIDFYLPSADLSRLLPDVRDHVTFGPARHADDWWDLTFMQLVYAGQQIELGGSDAARLRDHVTSRWVAVDIDFADAEQREIYGIVVPVIPKPRLIRYKKQLGRAVDRLDLAEIGVKGGPFSA